jgi:hypothetical protein
VRAKHAGLSGLQCNRHIALCLFSCHRLRRRKVTAHQDSRRNRGPEG